MLKKLILLIFTMPLLTGCFQNDMVSFWQTVVDDLETTNWSLETWNKYQCNRKNDIDYYARHIKERFKNYETGGGIEKIYNLAPHEKWLNQVYGRIVLHNPIYINHKGKKEKISILLGLTLNKKDDAYCIAGHSISNTGYREH